MVNDYTQAIAGYSLLLLISVIISVVSLTVALIKYLHSARIKNLASASSITAIGDAEKAATAQTLGRIVSKNLTKIGTPFVAKYLSAGKTHRILYMVGSIAALIATVLLGLLALYAVLNEQLPSLTAEIVNSSNHGLKYAVNNIILSLLALIGISVSFTAILSVFHYVGTRFLALHSIHRKRDAVEEPETVDRADLAMVSIGVVAPVAIVVVVLMASYYQGKYESYQDKVSGLYPILLKVPLAEEEGVDTTDIFSLPHSYGLFSEASVDNLQATLDEKFKELKEAPAIRKLVLDALIDFHLDQKTFGQPDLKTAEKVSLALLLIDEGESELSIKKEYFTKRPNYPRLKEAFDKVEADLHPYNGLLNQSLWGNTK